jgi:hypothetical protein
MASKDQVLRLRDENGGPYVSQHALSHSHIISTNIISRFRFEDLTGEMRYVAS